MRPNIGEILLGVVPDWRESFEMLIKYPHVGSKSVLQCANQCFMNVQFIIRCNAVRKCIHRAILESQTF